MGLLVAIVLVAVLVLVVWVMASRRPPTDGLYDKPEDLKRADDNQPPPVDGSGGSGAPSARIAADLATGTQRKANQMAGPTVSAPRWATDPGTRRATGC